MNLPYTSASAIHTQFPIPLGYTDHESYYFYNDNPTETYDAYDLFRFFNTYFFNNILDASQVKWSTRMTLCAGTCQLQAPGSCLITLSKSLLQFRSNNELKETLVHEMIHAYLFITNYKACHDRGGHGTEFCEIMNNINCITGLNISVYHNFHDEVEFFRKHIWKCNGPCQNKAPFFGYCRRAMNRAPGKTDNWWERHQRDCGGEFIKIDGPEFHKDENDKEKQKTKKRKAVSEQNTLNAFLKKTKLTNDNMQEELKSIDNIPKAFVFLLSKEEVLQYDKKLKMKKDDWEEETTSSERIMEISTNKTLDAPSISPNNVSKVIRDDEGKIKVELKKKDQNSEKRNGSLFDFMKRTVDNNELSSEKSKTKDSLNGTSSLDQFIYKKDTSKDYETNLSNLGSQVNTPHKSVFPVPELKGELIYSVLIKRDNCENSEKFWARILFHYEFTFSNLASVLQLVNPSLLKADTPMFIKDKDDINISNDSKLKEANLVEGSVLLEISSNVTIKLEKIFSIETAKNVNVLKAKQFPVCVGVSYFKEDGAPQDNNKEIVRVINEELQNFV